MENDENVARKKPGSLHSTQSQPIISGAGQEDDEGTGSQSKAGKEKGDAQKDSKNRRVSFANSSQLTQYLEPINPFESFAIPIANAQELSCLYQLSCEKHKTKPIPAILEHLESLNLEKSSKGRTEVLNLKQQTLTHESCEALEELFKRVKYRAIDVTGCSLDDSSASSLFDMIEYYEACNELNISENPNIKNRGWLACINMIKRSQALHNLATRGTPLSDSNAITLGNALSISFIYTLKLENCGLSGRPILCLSGALQKNRVLKELCLANNEMNANDAYNVGNILKNNYHLQLLDISNNDIQDEGFRHIAEALSYQSVHVSKTSSIDSLSSTSLNKFDFSDLTANLNNINNNRNRFSPTPPLTPLKVDSAGSIHHRNESNASSLNNNSILQQCDSERSGGVHKRQMSDGENVAVTDETSSGSEVAGKFKYTPESLSPISHGYEITPTNQIFNSRSPERSFSSESLCSETSVESNDSKSSIRLIESKFNNRNGTLERQLQQKNNETSSLVTSNEQEAMSGGGGGGGGVNSSIGGVNEKPPTGLQVLILWNNNLTSACSESAAYLLECTKFLQIINFGHNSIGNEFLVDTRVSLRTNDSLSSIGLQATNLTCDGLKVLAEILQTGGNSILQRIDLRSNNLSVTGLNALSEALKSNKSVIRVDLDDAPKNDDMLPLNSEIQRLVNTIRQQCAYNENPIEQEIPKAAAAAAPRPKRTNNNNNFNGRKISLTCSNVVKTTPPKQTQQQQQQQQLLEPIKKQANNRLRSPSPTLSPLSPLASPSRNRFQVSRVSESSSSGISSKSPSSSSSSPTFFPTNLSSSSSSSSSRFRVVTVSEPFKKVTTPPLPPKVIELKTEASKEIDIPAPSQKNSFLNSSTSFSIASSQSCEQLDSHYNVKNFIDLGDSCSSFSSIDSIDHHTDVSSNESFDMIEKSPLILNNDLNFYDEKFIDVNKSDDEIILAIDGECKKENALQSNENTLTKSTSSSSSSNEGLTLTTNSPTELSPKQEPTKRTRKTSWIQSAIGSAKDNNAPIYPATLDKLLNLFHHPTSLFTKSSPSAVESTVLASSPSSSSSGNFNKPPIAQKPNVSKESLGMGQKESSISGFIHSIVSLTSHKKEPTTTTSSSESSILQNISPENTIEKSSSHSQMLLESLPKSIKKELKENISPENTISSENYATVEQQKQKRVLFLVGDEEDLSVSEDCPANEDDDDVAYDKENSSLGDITRDSMTILKANSSGDQKLD